MTQSPLPLPRPGPRGPAAAERDARVTVVDDDPLARGRLSGALADGGYPVQAAVPSVEAASFESGVHMVVCDLHLPGRSGRDAVEYLVEHGCSVLATSSAATGDEILDAVSVGARGFSPKTAPAPRLASAVARLFEGRLFVGSALAQLLLESADKWPLGPGEIGSLETEVLHGLEQGDLEEEVGEELGLSDDELWASLERVWLAERRRGALRRGEPVRRRVGGSLSRPGSG